MEKLKNSLKSIKVKLFITLSIVILLIILFLIIVNNFVFGQFYLYKKKDTLKAVYNNVNSYYNYSANFDLEATLEKMAINNNFDILIKNNQNVNIYTSNKNFYATYDQISEITNSLATNPGKIMERNQMYTVREVKDTKNDITYILLSGRLDNGYLLYARVPITYIQESVKMSNNFLYLIAGFTIIISGIVVSYVARRFGDPITELNDIAKKMSNLDFSQKYEVKETDDEINNLGKSINTMSEKLETTINQLRNSNIELEKDIEEKSQIDEMRKSFISDVSHELKTPIALIQGYSEGLLENVNTDEESRKFYAEVILDEASKMDRLVKQLLELMKLEYGKREFQDKEFNIVELEREVIRKSNVMLEEEKIEVKFETLEEINVYADDFYIEQVITNYITNAIKHAKEVDGEKYIKIENQIENELNFETDKEIDKEIDKENNKKKKVRIKIFNTGEKIEEENLNRIWNRFYKADESRNRDNGGTGIGLALVKAIMNNYGNSYGVENKENGVEFYIDLEMSS